MCSCLEWNVHGNKKAYRIWRYYCYKKFISIIVLACVDTKGIYTSVNAGRPGSVGDSYTYRHIEMYHHIKQGEWLGHTQRTIEEVTVKFFWYHMLHSPLEATCLKCFDVAQIPQALSFNDAQNTDKNRKSGRTSFWNVERTLENHGWQMRNKRSCFC